MDLSYSLHLRVGRVRTRSSKYSGVHIAADIMWGPHSIRHTVGPTQHPIYSGTNTHTQHPTYSAAHAVSDSIHTGKTFSGKSANNCSYFPNLNMPLRLHRKSLFWLYNFKMSLNNCSIIITVHLLVIALIFIITEQNVKQHYLESMYACMHVTTKRTAFVFTVLLAC